MASPLKILKQFPFHCILLLLFFLLHGYLDYIGLVPFNDLLIYFLTGTAIGLIIFFIFNRLIHAPYKAAILTTIIFLFYFFYGSMKDALKQSALSPLSKYSILLPAMLIIIIVLIIHFRRTGKNYKQLNFYINILLLIYCLWDTGAIISKRGQPAKRIVNNSVNITVCDTCAKPEIHLIVLDEYAGDSSLKDLFHYDNSWFTDSLRKRNFFVASHSSSNYSSTPVSIASLYSMDYLPAFHHSITAEDYTRAENAINQSVVMKALQMHGYAYLNHSVFNIAGQPAMFHTDLLPMRLKLITAKTMWNSISRDLGWQVNVKLAPHMKWLANIIQQNYLEGNQRLLGMTNALPPSQNKPRFIYTHLLMPHWPYLLDSNGKSTGINFYDKQLSGQAKEAAYVQYLAYTSRAMLQLTDSIVARNKGNVAILLMSDHGYRDNPAKQDCRWMNNNFFSVYLPTKNYDQFYDSISNVNVFRAFFNSIFRQRFERLPDKCIF